MKKLAAILGILLLANLGYSDDKPVSPNIDKDNRCPVSELQWGMSKDEVASSLSAAKITYVPSTESNAWVNGVYCDGYFTRELFGQEFKICLSINDNQGLYNIRYAYTYNQYVTLKMNLVTNIAKVLLKKYHYEGVTGIEEKEKIEKARLAGENEVRDRINYGIEQLTKNRYMEGSFRHLFTDRDIRINYDISLQRVNDDFEKRKGAFTLSISYENLKIDRIINRNTNEYFNKKIEEYMTKF